MSLSQLLWSLTDKQPLASSELVSEQELEDALCEDISLLNPDWLLIGRQVKTRNGKKLDLLCIDRDEDLVVIELKKKLTPREVTAQVIEYASYVAEYESNQIAQIYQDFSANYLGSSGSLDEAFLAKFGIKLDEMQLNQRVKMVIAAAQMDDGTEHIIHYLRQTYEVDINILFFQVFQHGKDRILSRVWLEKDMELEELARHSQEWNGEYYVSFGSEERQWEDAEKFGFISAGGGTWYSHSLRKLQPGDRVWVNIPRTGYVGVGIVTHSAVQANTAILGGQAMIELPLKGSYFHHGDDPESAEYIVPVQWTKTVPKDEAVWEVGFFANQNSACQPAADKWQYTIDRLKKLWNIEG